MKRVEFRLTMPGRGGAVSSSWGEGRNYVIVRSLTDKVAATVIPSGHDTWHHRWDDGWVAQITGRVLSPRETAPKSDGFAGYEWMVDNIIRYGSTYTTGLADGMAGARP